MNANRVKIPTLGRQVRSLSSRRRHASRFAEHQVRRACARCPVHGQTDIRGVHSVCISHFKLSDAAGFCSGKDGSSSSDRDFESTDRSSSYTSSERSVLQSERSVLQSERSVLQSERSVLKSERSMLPSERSMLQIPHIISDSKASVKDNLDSDSRDSTQRLKAEFETARLCFKNIPSVLREMSKMDPNGVYANHNLRLDHINVFGFDYDYTLAHYTPELQTLIYDLAKERLVKEHRYPESCLSFTYDKRFPIRGLYYDKKKGYLLKLDFFHSVEPGGCFFGRQRVSDEEVEEAYGGKRISVEYMPNLVALMDLFCLSEVCLISDVIQHFVDEKVAFDPAYVYDDVKKSIEHVHKSGNLHMKILEDPAKYLVKSERLVQMLRNIKETGKQLFLLTNSPFPFVDRGMQYMFQEDESSGKSWRELFDVVIALADKPNFYTSDRPFRYYNSKKDTLGFSRVDEFHHHSVYYHGCLKHFLEITKWKGSEVLYFGDHLYSDLRGPARAGWRTAAIIRELEREIRIQNEDKYRFQQAKYHIMQELLGKFHGLRIANPKGDDELNLLSSLRDERQKARAAMKTMFNPYFGSTFLTDTGKESAFSYNVQRYADVYTSRLENFLQLSLEAWLYTPFDVKILPHHIKVSPASLLRSFVP